MKKTVNKLLSLLDPRYKELHWGFLWDKKFGYIWLLIFWPLFGIVFHLLEKADSEGWRTEFISIYSPLDDLVPFLEWFLIPYLFWFVYLVGMYAYTLLFEVEIFKKLMYFTILTYGITIIIYILFPNMQELRPVDFPRDNFLTRFMSGYYAMDTNTNVCPSLHVIGSFCVQTAAWHSKRFGTTGWRIAFTVTTVLISVSTVFLKQHSVLDIPPALLICLLAYIPVYLLPSVKAKKALLHCGERA